MNWVYPFKYSDARGVEIAQLHNDGRKLSVQLRGIAFSGSWFDDFEPNSEISAELLKQFTFASGSLCDCTIECDIPIDLVSDINTDSGLLRMRLELGGPADNGGIDREVLSLELIACGQTYRSSGTSWGFEDELLNLQSMLPEPTYLKACINCGYSDYSPYGNGMFGCMLCFRNLKAEYEQVRNKDDLFRILDKGDLTQETYVCPDFKRRLPKTGYRG